MKSLKEIPKDQQNPDQLNQAEDELKSALKTEHSVFPGLASWVAEKSVVAPWTLNCIVLNIMSATHWLRNVEVSIVFETNEIHVYAIVGLWTLLREKRVRRIRQIATEVCTGYLQKYKPVIHIKYGHKV